MHKLLSKREFIFILAIVLALATGQGAVWTEPLILPVLAVAMTLSTIIITNRDLASIKYSPRSMLISLLLNYVVMSGLMLLMARWLINDSKLWAGFVTIAAMPPAIAVVPFTYMLGGNVVFSLVGTIGLYLAALGLAPGIMTILLGTHFFNPIKLLLILAQLVVIPLGISRILLSAGLAQTIARWRDTAVNWCFFIVIFTVIGLNRQVFFEQPDVLLNILLIGAAISFGVGHIIDFIARRLRINRSNGISFTLMSTRKNNGLASGIAIAIFGRKAAIPTAIFTIFDVISILWWGFYFKKRAYT